MSVADPEVMVKYMSKLNVHMHKFNTVVTGLTRVIDKNIRAQTKVIAMASKTKGMMLGVVADLELMGGAFGKIKRALANIFLPVQEDTPKLFKYAQGLITLSGAYSNILSPTWQMIKGTKDRIKTINQELAIKNKLSSTNKAVISGMSQMNARFNLFSRLTRGTQTLRAYPRHQIAGLGGATEAGYPIMPTDTTFGRVPAQGAAPSSLMGLEPLTKPSTWENIKKGTEGLTDLGTSKMKGAMKFWKSNVTTPIKQIASGGIGLGFQVSIVMGLMQAFAGLFTIFQPIIEIVGALVERISVGFIPIIEILMEILTSEPVLAMVEMLANALAEIFEMFRPLVPIIIQLVEVAMKPLMGIITAIMPIIAIMVDLIGALLIAFMPLIDILLGALAPVIEWLVKIFAMLVVAGMYPVIGAIYGIGIAIAAIMDLFTLFTQDYIGQWNDLMLPIFGALNVAMGAVVGTFQTGTDYVPQTGIYILHKGERVETAEENRAGRSQPIVINMYGSYLGADMEDLSNRIAKKLSLHRF